MIIKATIDYRDLQRQVDVKVGDEYEVTEERGKQIVDAGYAIELVHVEVNRKAEDAEKPAENGPESAPNEKPEAQPIDKPKRRRKANKTE